MEDISWSLDITEDIFDSFNESPPKENEETSDFNPSEEQSAPSQSNSESGSSAELESQVFSDWIREHQERTAHLRTEAWPTIAAKVQSVLDFMETQGLDLPIFLDALSWGTKECRTNSVISNARIVLLTSKELPLIIRKWWKPPKSNANTVMPRGATQAIQEVALKVITDSINGEMKQAPNLLRSRCGNGSENDLSLSELQNLSYVDLIVQMQILFPTIWNILETCARGPKRSARRKNTRKPERVIMTAIAMLAYTQRHSYNRLQKLFSVYFKFHGLSAKAFDTLHSLGITMSMKWTTECVSEIAACSMKELKSIRDNCLWFMSHDNINIAFHVYSQRVNKQTHFDSGTAATVFVKPNEPPIPPSIRESIRETRRDGLSNPVTIKDLFMLDKNSSAKLRPFLRFHILKVLLDAPDFDFKQYQYRDSELLQRPAALFQLPHGPEHVAKQYILGTVKIEEATYEGNSRLVTEWMQQLGLYKEDEIVRTALERLIFFIGDLLTVDRLKSLYKMRAEDYNSFDRFDFIQVVAGWLHIMMAYANSLHSQYLGTPAGRGLHHAMILLKRKGLLRTMTKGPFYHDLKELLIQVTQGLVRTCWHQVSGEEIEDLRKKSPEVLVQLADQILDEFASTKAMQDVKKQEEVPYDEVKCQTIMMIRDLLHYVSLENAIKHGDVGFMRTMLPHLLYRFHGGSNPNYARGMLDLLQALEKEMSEEVVNYVLGHCWLINFQGRYDSFLPVDMAQEHNIRDIKDTYRPDGPNNDWEYLRKISPAIPFIKSIAKHVEDESGVLSRGKKHTIPDATADILLLERSYRDSTLLVDDVDRKVGDDDYALDVLIQGMLLIQKDDFVKNWHNSRYFKRSTAQIFDDSSSSSSEEEEEDVDEEEDEEDEVEELAQSEMDVVEDESASSDIDIDSAAINYVQEASSDIDDMYVTE